MSATWTAGPSGAASSQASKVRFRRAVMLLIMSVVLPGSAQLAAGNKRVGRIAMRTFLAAVFFVFILLVVAVTSESRIVTLFTKTWFLGVLRFGLIGYALGWAYLIIDAWRIADPLALAQRQRLTMTVLNGVLCLSLTGTLLYASQFFAVQRDFIKTVFVSHVVTSAQHGRYNVLLLGGDAGPRRVGIRPDSVTVASIDADTGRTILFGLPRNLADVPFPPHSVMHRQFPHGFDCTEECYLNAVNTWATDHADLFPGVDDPGILATTQAVEQITGLPINYYVLIDLGGFQHLVDAVGGITIDVHQKLPIGGVGGPISGYINPGRQKLNGFQTLWYSRSRAWSDDYSRMARQKCVMDAMLHQISPRTVITKFGAIADAGKQIISTSIPGSQLGTFVNLALQARRQPVATVSFVPPKINTSDPNWTLIRSMVSAAIARSEGAGAASHDSKHSEPGHTGQTYAANDASNLASAC